MEEIRLERINMMVMDTVVVTDGGRYWSRMVVGGVVEVCALVIIGGV